MAFPTTEAGLRALDARCSDLTSADYRRTVSQLKEQTREMQLHVLLLTVILDLAHVCRCLLAAGLPPSSLLKATLPQHNDLSAVVVAARQGSAGVLKVLLEGGAAHTVGVDGSTMPLYLAAGQGHVRCVQILLDAGADPDTPDSLGNTPLIIAGVFNRWEAFAALLPVSDIERTTLEGTTVLHVCVADASLECFKLLLPLVRDVDERTVKGEDGSPTERAFGRSALHIASQKGQHQMAKALLKRGADRMARDQQQSTPLHQAALHGHLSCIVRLLEKPCPMTAAEVNAPARGGITALHCAAQGGFEKGCGVLIQAGARLDVTNSDGHTPLMFAQHFHPDNTALLALLSGAGPAQPPGTVCDHCGKTPEQASVNILKACGNCHAARYCGADCAAAAWPGHKAACRARKAEVEARTKPRIVGGPAESE